MQTRSKRATLEPFDPEIEASNRRRSGRRARESREQREPTENHLEPMAEGNAPDQAAIIAQLQRQLQAMETRMAAEAAEQARAAGMPVRNQFANVAIPVQPVGPRIEANTFELKTGLVQMARDIPFAGRSAEDAPKHLTKFLQIANTIKYNGVPDDVVKIRLFPFSLVDDAKDWYDSLEPTSVRTWNQLAELFLEKYHPLRTTLKLQAEITQFKMRAQETMGEAWERFKGLLRRCPNHGLNQGYQISIFYNGCHDEIRANLDYGSSGSFLDLGDEDCKRMLEKLACTNKGWSSGRDVSYRVAATTDSDPIGLITQQLQLMNQKIDNMKGSSNSGEQPYEVTEDVNYVHQGGQNRNYNNYRSNQGSGGYNPNKPYPNLSYGNTNNTVYAPPGFSAPKGEVEEHTSSTTDDLIRALMVKTNNYMVGCNQRVDKVESAVVELSARMGSLGI